MGLIVAMLAVEQLQVTHEVQIWAPDDVLVGTSVPVRALVMGDVDAPEGPHLVVEGVTATLRGRTRVSTSALRPAAQGSVEGELVAEEVGRATLHVEARSVSGRVLATASRSVSIVGSGAGRARTRQRLADALQRLVLARTPEILEVAPELDVRVEGGVCVPEQPCRLWLWRGEGAWEPLLSECTSVDVGPPGASGSLASIVVVVHGPEARCRLTLSPSRVSTDLQLPVGLATPWVDLETRGAELVVRGVPPVGRDAMLLDVYVDGRWRHARTLRRDAELRVPVSSGLVLVQARADVASSERGYVRAAFLEGSEPRDAAEQEARALRSALGLDAEVNEPVEETRLRWWRLALEEAPIDVPALVSGLADDEASLARTRTRMRWIAGLGAALALVAVLVVVARRGWAAAREARSVLVAAGDEGADDASARWRSAFVVAGFVAGVGLAILLGAAFLVARPYFMG